MLSFLSCFCQNRYFFTKNFLDQNVSHSNLKLTSVITDLRDERIISIIAVLSFFHVFLTEPYWMLLNSSKSYADFPCYVKQMKQVLDLWGSDDFVPTSASRVFNDFVSKDIESVMYDFFQSDLFD